VDSGNFEFFMGKRWAGVGIDGRWDYYKRHSNLESGHWSQGTLHDQNGMEWVKLRVERIGARNGRGIVLQIMLSTRVGIRRELLKIVHVVCSVQTLHFSHQPDTVSFSDPFLDAVSNIPHEPFVSLVDEE
jgi:hypothetical protein